jgi:hypothetical protein
MPASFQLGKQLAAGGWQGMFDRIVPSAKSSRPIVPSSSPRWFGGQVKFFTNFSCEAGGQLLKHALDFVVSRTTFNS